MDLSKLTGSIWLDGELVPWEEAKVHVFEPEHRHAIKPSLRDSLRFRKAQFEHGPKWVIHSKPAETWFGFQAIRPIAGIELLMVPLIGHTRGHVGVASGSFHRLSGGLVQRGGEQCGRGLAPHAVHVL